MTFELITVSLATGLFLGMLLLSEVGRRIGVARFRQLPGATSHEGGAAEAAVFGLLGLLIAFTFSGAASRFFDRRQLIAAESNAIGTAYLRLDLLASDARPPIRDLFRRYVEVRSTVYRGGDLEATSARLAEGESLQAAIWQQTVRASQQPGTAPAATMLLLPALNEMIDITTTRVVATATHPPTEIYILLCTLSLVGAMLVGHSTSAGTDRHWFYPVLFAGILSLTVFVIIDVEYPRLGFIRVDAADQVLIDLRKTMQ